MMRVAARLRVPLAVISCLIAGCGEAPTAKPIRPVRAIKVGDAGALARRSFPGRAEPTEEVNHSFRVSGPLVELSVDVGDEVEKDQVVARIDPRDFQVRLRSAEADLAAQQAKLRAMKIGARPEEFKQLEAAVDRTEARLRTANAEYARSERLIKTKVITQAAFDRIVESRDAAVAGLRQAREDLSIGQKGARKEDVDAKEAEIRSLTAAMETASDQLKYTYLRAPFAGTVSAKYVENFQTVQAKQPIVRVIDTSKIEMTVDIPEHLISLVEQAKAQDRSIVCQFDAFPDVQVSGLIKEIGKEASRSTRTFAVTLIMEQPKDVKILPGMAGRAQGKDDPNDQKDTAIESEPSFLIPETALLDESGGQQIVWVVDPSSKKVSRQKVAKGKVTQQGVSVTGLTAGQWVVTAGVHFLDDGEQVRLPDDAPKDGESKEDAK